MPAARTSAAPVGLALLVALVFAGCGGGGAGSVSHGSITRTGSSVPVRPLHAVADYDTDDYSAGSGSDADDDDSPSADRDGDSDGETAGFFDADDTYYTRFGHAAGAPDAKQLRSVIERYFAAIAALDGRAACALMPSSIAKHIPEIFGKGIGPPYARGSSCPQITANVFAFYRRQLLSEAGALEVAVTRVDGARALVVLTFKRARGYPARLIELVRVGDGWRVNGMLDNELP